MSAPTTRSKAKAQTVGLEQTTSPVASEYTTSTETSVMQTENTDAIRTGEEKLRSEGTVVNRRTTGSRISTSSNKKRDELLARLEFQEKEKERTEAAAALAETKLRLIELNDDDAAELSDVDNGNMVSDWVDKSNVRKGKENKKDNIADLATAIVDAINSTKSNVPKVPPKYINELQYFDGDPREWISFRANFKDTATYFSNIENVARLRKAIKGQARDSVKSLMYTTQNPDEILQALERRFGRPTFLIKSEIEALEKIPPMSSEITGIGSFASAVANSVNTIKLMNKVEYLYSYDISEKIIEKMNIIVRFRWHEYRSAHEEEPILLSLSKFLNTIADQFEVYEHVPKPRARRDFHKVPLRKRVNAATYASESERSENSESESDPEYEEERRIVLAAMNTKCPLCQKNHDLQKCDLFKNQKVPERWASVKTLKVCFKCLRPNHMGINCKAKTCTIDGCIGRHHPLLHSEHSQREDSIKETKTVSVNHISNKRAYLKILPVDLTGPKGTVTVGALLDEGSTVTLLLDEVAQQIGATGPKREISIEGVTGHLMRAERSEKVDFRIRGKQTHNIEHVSAYTIPELNLTPQQISYEDIKDCPHLKSVGDRITYENLQPSILIGQDNWHLIVTRELKTGGVNKPVASLTKLGWVLHGYRTSAVKPVMFTGHVSYKSQNCIENMIKNQFELDSIGITPKKPINDPEERALSILRTTTRRLPEGRFECGLLWKTDGEIMPPNRESALKRFTAIERKMSKDRAFKTKYSEQVENLLKNGYAEIALTPPTRDRKLAMDTSEERKLVTNTTLSPPHVSPIPDPLRFSTWSRLLHSTGRLPQSIEKFKSMIEKPSQVTVIKKTVSDVTWRKYDRKNKNRPTLEPPAVATCQTIPLPNRFLADAEKLLTKTVQRESFKDELKNLRDSEPILKSSRLSKLNITLIDDVVHLDTRISAATYLTDTYKNPTILDGNHPITRLLVMKYHTDCGHGNHQTVMNELRQRYYITSLRNTVKITNRTCQWCRVHKATPLLPPTGDLPVERLQHRQYPFTCTGVDYFGPVQITVGRRQEKRWIALYTCLTTRAIHLEIASSLSTDSMLLSLRRMIARRGTPKVLYSDNGTNFIGADKEMSKVAEQRQITWKRIPAGAPHMGGAWERMVLTVKTALIATLRSRQPREEVLHTLLLEAEHLVNSRPLTGVSLDPDDAESLTPNHFLIGRSNGAPRPGEFNDRDLVGPATWRTAQRMADMFWSRWLTEYLPTIAPRYNTGSSEFQNPSPGDIVLIIDSSLPRGVWPRGEIVKVYPGPDKKVRTVEVRTTAGVLKRPTSRLIKITKK